ncbi:MAG TPA: MFS transporter [Bryobacteraceae bacterium]|nr:MFS transporter [Bryobacteraceae bacterium]
MSPSPEKGVPRIAWVAVGALWLAYVLNYLDRQVVFSIFPALKQELHFTDAQLGLIGSLFVSVYSLCMPITGRLADILRRDRVIVASLVLWSLATLGTAISRSVGEFLAWRVVMGVMESMYVPAALGLIAALHTGSTRSRALATHATAQFVGIVAGGWYGGWMADNIGWRPGFFTLTVAGAVYAVVLLLVFRGLPPLSAPEKRNQAASMLAIFGARSYLALIAAFFAFCIMLWMLYAWLPNFLYERYHLSMTESGFTATIYLQVSSAVGVLAGGWLGDRFAKRYRGGRFYLCGAGLILCAPFAYLAIATHSLLVLKLGATAFGLTAGLYMANHFAAAFDVLSPHNYGVGSGVLNMMGGLSGSAAIFLAGLWKNSLGMTGLMAWGAAGTLVTSAFMIGVVAFQFQADRRRAGLE